MILVEGIWCWVSARCTCKGIGTGAAFRCGSSWAVVHTFIHVNVLMADRALSCTMVVCQIHVNDIPLASCTLVAITVGVRGIAEWAALDTFVRVVVSIQCRPTTSFALSTVTSWIRISWVDVNWALTWRARRNTCMV